MQTRSSVIVGTKLWRLYREHAAWSQVTFGSDHERGPQGALKHLAKEAGEASESPGDWSEYADCLLLTLDAARRAGLTLENLLDAALEKMAVNRSRKWPTPVEGEPCEHVEGD